MITFDQTSMNGDDWTTGVPLNTELVAGCSHGTMPAHVWNERPHSWNKHTHTHYCLCQLEICFTHTSLSLRLLQLPTNAYGDFKIAPSYLEATPNGHTTRSMLRKRAGAHKREEGKKEKKSLSNSKSQRGHRNNPQSQSGSHGDKCGSVQ